MKEITEAEMLRKAAIWCSTTERCVQDVEKKVFAAGLSQEAADRIIERLKKEKFLDESRFVHAFTHDKLRFNKWGRVKIGYELRKRGIAPSLCEAAFEAIDPREYETILTTLLSDKQRQTKGKDQATVTQKLLRFGVSHGFTMEEVFRCLKRLTNESIDYDHLSEEDWE
ncbi:RecX family transcriptional regulator [Parabacteroides sp. OttesenSCG-928-N08]|nr:RecX family transcriptional regulator [Parabacteroides sp. OttesenSCG-928-N08]